MRNKILSKDKDILDYNKLQTLLERNGIEYLDEIRLDKGRRMKVSLNSFTAEPIHRLNDGRVVVQNDDIIADDMVEYPTHDGSNKNASLEELVLFVLQKTGVKLFLPKSYQIVTSTSSRPPEHGVVGEVKVEKKFSEICGKYNLYTWDCIHLTYYADINLGIIVRKVPEHAFDQFFYKEMENVIKDSARSKEQWLKEHRDRYPYGCGTIMKYFEPNTDEKKGGAFENIFYEIV